MKSNLKKRIWSSITTLVLIISVFCSNGVISSQAYDDIFGLNLNDMRYYDKNNTELYRTTQFQTNTGYGFNLYSYQSDSFNDVRRFELSFKQDFLPFVFDAYDYYFYTTFFANIDVANMSFCPTEMALNSDVCDGNDSYFPCENLKVYHHDGYINHTYCGFSAVGKVSDMIDSSSLRSVVLVDSNGGTVPYERMYFRVQCFAVPKGTSPEGVYDAIDEHLQAIENSAASIVEELIAIEDALDELMNDFSGTPINQVVDAFWDSSDELNSYEQDLMSQSSDSVNTYMSDSFDLSVLDTLGGSLTFVVTWFTNFWNMGGAFTDTLNLLFAISIVFYVIKVR